MYIKHMNVQSSLGSNTFDLNARTGGDISNWVDFKAFLIKE